MLYIFGLGLILEGLLYATWLWRFRTIFAVVSIAATIAACLWLAFVQRNTMSILILILGIYRAINLLRILETKMHEKYLRRVCFRSSLWFISAQALSGGAWFMFSRLQISISSSDILILATFLQLLVSLVICLVALRNIHKMKFIPSDIHFSMQELPTVTVGIPARNETNELEHCIESVLASDYPKLEVLVLDDCSQDRTAEIIRSYAQSGVRFIHGNEPKENWLAKNQAYDQLSDEANGDYIIFLGVDTQIGPHTITELIRIALTRKKEMVSVLPKRANQSASASLIQPMRYWWELALPRRLFNRPAVLSTLWMIKRTSLKQAGGFDAVSRSVIPEAQFARQLIKHDAYSFVRSSGVLTVLTSKGFSDQFSRAVRFRYPEVHRKLELVAGISALEIIFLLLPFASFVLGIFISPMATILALIACILLIATQYLILSVTSTAATHYALINYIIGACIEIFIGNYSMWKYEFSDVDWKGRNICIPVMHTSSHLNND